jgi:hypothetical protein
MLDKIWYVFHPCDGRDWDHDTYVAGVEGNMNTYGDTLVEALGKLVLRLNAIDRIEIIDASRVPFRPEWDTMVKVSSSQEAWHDIIEYRVRYQGQFQTDLANIMLKKQFPNESSYGALSWRTGQHITRVDELRREFTIELTYRICD